jgi:hypothetical protein
MSFRLPPLPYPADAGRPGAVVRSTIARAGHRLHEPVGRDLTDPAVQVIRDVHVPRGIEGQVEGSAEQRVGAMLPVAAVGANGDPSVVGDVLPVLVAARAEAHAGSRARHYRRPTLGTRVGHFVDAPVQRVDRVQRAVRGEGDARVVGAPVQPPRRRACIGRIDAPVVEVAVSVDCDPRCARAAAVRLILRRTRL